MSIHSLELNNMILIYPPVAKPGEPPAGVARLSGVLSYHNINHTVVDLNLETLEHIIHETRPDPFRTYDKWTARSLRYISDNYNVLRDDETYGSLDRYKRAVIDLNHAVESRTANGACAGLANYRHRELSPLRSEDLLKAAEHPEDNPYFMYFSTRLTSLIRECAPLIMGFSLSYLSQALSTFAIIGFLKKRFPHLSIVIGGGLITSWMRNPEWHNPFKGLVDHLVSGPGERPLLNLLGVMEKNETYSGPDYKKLSLHNYLSPGVILPYSASSGCHWNRCSFCPEHAEDNPYVPVKTDHVIRDLSRLISETGPRIIHLLDNAISTSLLKKLADSMSIPWYGFAKIHPLLTDPEFCMALKKSGCIMLKLGLESGDQRVLDTMQKGIDVSTASLVLKTLKNAGIATYVYVMFGTPAETENEAGKTLDFVINHKEEVDFLNVAIFNMPVCSPEVSQYRTRKFYEGDLSLYTDFEHPDGWNRKKVRNFLKHEFNSNKAVAAILNNDPPIFTSNHAPFFVMRR